MILGAAAALGAQLPLWSTAPFVLLLLSIALTPLIAGHWWERNRNKAIVAALLTAPLVVYMIAAHGVQGGYELLQQTTEYVSFMILLLALFIISGGIFIKGSLSGTPLMNTLLIAVGGAMASLIGTTGASVLLIRPLLRANASRHRKVHVVVFFIFVVSNCGGLLTPLGDPPLFLGFLYGVPFEWTLQLWRQWALVNGLLLVIFNLWDQYQLDKEEKERAGSQLEEVMRHEPLGFSGLTNVLFLAGVVAVVYASGRGLLLKEGKWPYGLAEGMLVLLAAVSYLTTSRAIHERNRFSFGPILEVAILFAGIFVTMTPALLILNARGAELGLSLPWHFFWASGILSSFLDNAPTYLAFATMAAGLHGIPPEPGYLAHYLALDPAANTHQVLAAISCGSVFMGANTYIGNGPNFMVKAIAEENGVRMPGFFGYMLYSGCVLIPIFIGVTFLFFV